MAKIRFIEWNDSFSVGFKMLDEQHKQVVKIINSLFKSLQGNIAEQDIRNLVKKIELYTNSHLVYEETILKYVHYKEYKEHRKIHNVLRLKIRELLLNIDRNPVKLVKDSMEFLRDLWLTHIRQVDFKYRDAIRFLDF